MSTPTEIAREHIAREKARGGAATKREAWEALKRYTPEFVPEVRRISERFGIAGVRVKADGDVVLWQSSEIRRRASNG